MGLTKFILNCIITCLQKLYSLIDKIWIGIKTLLSDKEISNNSIILDSDTLYKRLHLKSNVFRIFVISSTLFLVFVSTFKIEIFKKDDYTKYIHFDSTPQKEYINKFLNDYYLYDVITRAIKHDKIDKKDAILVEKHLYIKDSDNIEPVIVFALIIDFLSFLMSLVCVIILLMYYHDYDLYLKRLSSNLSRQARALSISLTNNEIGPKKEYKILKHMDVDKVRGIIYRKMYNLLYSSKNPKSLKNELRRLSFETFIYAILIPSLIVTVFSKNITDSLTSTSKLIVALYAFTIAILCFIYCAIIFYYTVKSKDFDKLEDKWMRIVDYDIAELEIKFRDCINPEVDDELNKMMKGISYSIAEANDWIPKRPNANIFKIFNIFISINLLVCFAYFAISTMNWSFNIDTYGKKFKDKYNKSVEEITYEEYKEFPAVNYETDISYSILNDYIRIIYGNNVPIFSAYPLGKLLTNPVIGCIFTTFITIISLTIFILVFIMEMLAYYSNGYTMDSINHIRSVSIIYRKSSGIFRYIANIIVAFIPLFMLILITVYWLITVGFTCGIYYMILDKVPIAAFRLFITIMSFAFIVTLEIALFRRLFKNYLSNVCEL